MKVHSITATVTVSVEMKIKALSKEEARRVFDDRISVDATLMDVSADRFSVVYSDVEEVDDVVVEDDSSV